MPLVPVFELALGEFPDAAAEEDDEEEVPGGRARTDASSPFAFC